MVDLQVIEIRDILRITGVRPVQDSDPPTLDVAGRDFNNIQELRINEVKSPSLVVINSTRLLAQVPETQESMPIRSIVAISNRLTRTDRSIINFRIGDTPRSVDGMERLIQTFLKLMLQSPGTDIFAPKVGGGLIRAVGKQIRNPSSATLVSDFSLAVARARQQLMSLQANDPTVDLSERLLHARVLDAKFIPSELALVGKIAIGNQQGRSSMVGLGL